MDFFTSYFLCFFHRCSFDNFLFLWRCFLNGLFTIVIFKVLSHIHIPILPVHWPFGRPYYPLLWTWRFVAVFVGLFNMLVQVDRFGLNEPMALIVESLIVKFLSLNGMLGSLSPHIRAHLRAIRRHSLMYLTRSCSFLMISLLRFLCLVIINSHNVLLRFDEILLIL